MRIPTRTGSLKLLVDSGSNQSYINKKWVKLDLAKSSSPIVVNNIKGQVKLEKYVEFNPFPQSKTSSKIRFYAFDFHNFFDGLIGYEALQQLGASINSSTNELILPDTKIKMNRKFSGNSMIEIQAMETKFVNLQVKQDRGDFLIADDIEISPSIYVNSGIYDIKDGKVLISVTNKTNKDKKLAVGALSTEINNFETLPSNESKQKQSGFARKKPPEIDMKNLIRTSHLNAEEEKQIFKLISKFSDVCHTENKKLTFTNAIKHQIRTTDENPVYTKSYRYPHCHKQEVRRQIDKMLEDGIIRHSSSPWSAPVWVVPKKSDASGKKKWRLVIDYRKVNEKTVSDRYPMPDITDILDKLGRCNYFSTLDLASGFHQVEVHPDDIEKTAFSVEGGHYEFPRMPFGLKNAPSTFQRVMDQVLREFVGHFVCVYMDDIIVFSTSLQEHTDHLKKVLETLSQYNLKLQLDKCEFLCKEVAFLGHVVTPEGVKPNPEKIKAIRNWPIPRNEKELRRFLGTVGYYRRFIRDLAKIIKPLTKTLEKGNKVTHEPEFVKAFEKCKSILSSSDVLQYPDFEKEFVLTTDASDYAIGAVLSQGNIGEDRPVAFASRTLNGAEQGYSAVEKELLAIVWATRYFRPYLFGRKFTLYTDHKPLSYAFGQKTTNARLIRWRLALAEYDMTIKYRPGSQNTVADGLSRAHDINFHDASDIATRGSIANDDENESDTESENADSSDETVHSADTDDLYFIPMTEKPLNVFSNQIVFEEGRNEDDTTEEVFTKIFRHTLTETIWDEQSITSKLKERLDPRRTNCIMCPENLIQRIQEAYRNHFSQNQNIKIKMAQRILIDIKTIEEQNLLIEEIHQKAHRGVDENLKAISATSYFPSMKSKVSKFISLCTTCKKAKYDRKPYKITYAETPIPKRPLEIVHFDIFISKPDLFLSAVDKLSRFGILIPIKSRAIVDIRKAILKFTSTYGSPSLAVFDNEPSFRSVEVRGLLESLNTQTYFTPPNRSEVNGIVERFHSTIAEIFRCIKDRLSDIPQKQIFLAAVTHYNSTYHSATKLKPREVFYGIRENEERRLDAEAILQNHNQICDEVVLQLIKRQKADLDRANATREQEPEMTQGDAIFVKRQGVKSKTKDMFIQAEVQSNKRKTVEDTSGRRVHKANIKRKPITQ